MLRTLTITAVVAITNAQKQYVATFETAANGITGTVTVDSRSVSVDLDLSSEPVLPGGFTACVGDGLKWHIHKIWTHSDTADKLGSDLCNSTYTSGHYDPWNACGSASGNAYCKKSTSTGATQCIDVDDYSPNFPDDPFSVEIGDWSSKYGVLPLDDDNKILESFDSFYEIQPSQLVDLSIVFHCNSGTRAFCAPFLESVVAVTDTTMNQETTETVAATFDVLSGDSVVILYPNGNVSINLDATNIGFSEATYGCNEFEYSIFDVASGETLESSKLGEDCEDVVGDQYDPTDQCLPWASSTYCDDGLLCTDAAYAYACDYDSDRYSCAPADLSGKFGTWSNVGTNKLEVDETGDTLTPPTDDLVGKIVAVTCLKTDAVTTPKFLACAVIEEYEGESGVIRISYAIAFVLSLISLAY